MANNPFMLLVLGLGFGAVYYLLFRVLIKALNLKTPGREDEDNEEELKIEASNSNHAEVAAVIYEALGGKDNVVSIDNCATRLRLEVKDSILIDDKKIKKVAAGIIKPSIGLVLRLVEWKFFLCLSISPPSHGLGRQDRCTYFRFV